MRRRRERGFTLVELMVVVAIIAILGALLVGASGRTYGVNATTFADQIAQTFQYARSRALQTRKIHRVELHFSGLPDQEIRVYQTSVSGMKRTNIDPTSLPTDIPPKYQFIERTIVPKSVMLYHAIHGAKPAGLYSTPSGGSPPPQTTGVYYIDFLPNGTADAVTTGSTPSDATTVYVTDPGDARSNRVIVYSVTGSSYVRKSW